MKELIFFILVCYGATLIAVYGKIFDKIRPKHHFFKCPMCVGFWVGIFVSFLLIGITNIKLLLMLGFLSSGTSYTLCSIFDDSGIKVELNK